MSAIQPATITPRRRRVGVFSSSRGDARAAAAIVDALVDRDDVEPVVYVSGVHVVQGFGQTLAVPDEVELWRIECDLGSDDRPDRSPRDVRHHQRLGGCVRARRHPRGHRRPIRTTSGRDDGDALSSADRTRQRWEVTEGAIDDSIRHALTKLSHLHLVGAPAFTISSRSSARNAGASMSPATRRSTGCWRHRAARRRAPDWRTGSARRCATRPLWSPTIRRRLCLSWRPPSWRP